MLRFTPRWTWTLFALLAITAFVSLGRWQWQRGEMRAADWAAFEKSAQPAIDVTVAQLADLPDYTRVRVSGNWDASRQFLLDNRPYDGRPGYEVLTALELDGGRALAVNRGWLPFDGYRDRLPDLTVAAGGPVSITGRLAGLPVPGLAAGHAAPPAAGSWPRVTSFPTFAELSAARGGGELIPRVLLLDADSGEGYLRDWRPGGIDPEKHFGYAAQWWLFAAVAFGLYVWLNLKRVK